MDIIKNILDELPPKSIAEAYFEGANIVLYTDSPEFFREGESKVRDIVRKIKKRIELRSVEKILLSQEAAEKVVREVVPSDAEITSIIFDVPRSILIIGAKKPGIVIGKGGSILQEIKQKTLWSPQIQRSPAIPSKITENIRNVLYLNNSYRKKFLHNLGKKIYKEWSPDRVNEWVRLTCLGASRQVGRSCFLLQTPESKVLLDCGVDVTGRGGDKFPYLDIPEFDINEIDAIIISHAHLDHNGLVPYLYKMGYRGPCYMTPPSRDISALIALDFIGVAYKKAENPLFSAKDIKEMVRHTVCLGYNEVTDITPDIRLTFYNAGHVLGSALCHLNIGNGLHNFVYTGDMKYGRTRLLDPAQTNFPRMETLMIESTYGAKDDKYPPYADQERVFIDMINKTIARGGKILVPELGLGRAQETMLILDDAMRKGLLPKIPIYIDGMIWDINAIHTAYPDFLSMNVRSMIFRDDNPFLSDIFSRVGSPAERKAVIDGGPCLVLATSGMLTGGASVEYLRAFASNPNNSLIFICYQGAGGYGRRIQEGEKEIIMDSEGKDELVKINLEVNTIRGFTSHSLRNQLIAFINNCKPSPKRVIVVHGEQSKSLDFASAIHKLHRIETNVPRNLETLRLK
ncbi:beta-CASP ribonuclease aCPSF1 [Candidatus Pacearchaeota archaeon CG10_big_fil_rev_8_21_14_0_10_35_13]|nr:MAG: beta-CASP ribonuclease aCPSF1 [Candidatus Pacearchaeota archaeon CG10_big_fil_rev_8_21_14_0_10_35_13]